MAVAPVEAVPAVVRTSTDDALSNFLAELRTWFAATPLNDESTGPVTDSTDQLSDTYVAKLTAFVNYDNIARKRNWADRLEYLAIALNAFKIRLVDVLLHVCSWDQLASAFIDEAVHLTISRREDRSATPFSSSDWTPSGGHMPATRSNPRWRSSSTYPGPLKTQPPSATTRRHITTSPT